jgi:AcrR family transcriptional regulator
MGTLERRAREKQLRTETILKAAEEVFFAKGYESTTVDDVAHRVELSKGTVYLYFRNKEDLYLALCTKALEALNKQYAEAAKAEKLGLDKLLAIAYTYLRFAQQQPDYFRTFTFLYRPQGIDLTEGGHGLVCKELLQRNQNLLLTAVQVGVVDGSIQPNLVPLKAAIVFEAQLYGVLQFVGQSLLQNSTEHENAAKSLFHTFIDLMTKAFKPEAAPAKVGVQAAAKPAQKQTEQPPATAILVSQPERKKPEAKPVPPVEQSSLF